MSKIEVKRPTRAEINLDDLAFNFRSVKAFVGEEIEYMAVVKANAYGHGAPACSLRLEEEGVDWLGVALPEEGVELREAGVRIPILCLGGFWVGQEEMLLDHDLTPVIFQIEKARLLGELAEQHGKTIPVHIKVDTGAGRIGIRHDQVESFAASLREIRSLRVDGIMTHFASADDLAENEFTSLQIRRYQDAVAVFHTAGFTPRFYDLANSPAAIGHPDSRGNLVRLGGVLYGLGGDILPKEIDKPDLRPVLSLRSRIAYLKRVPAGETIGYGRTFTTTRDSLIATVPIGYEDGYRRLLSNRANVIVRGAMAPVVGRISMDWTTVDVTEVEGVGIGDEVVLIGSQGGSWITAEQLAADLDTISYEITCGIDRRVPRVYSSRP